MTTARPNRFSYEATRETIARLHSVLLFSVLRLTSTSILTYIDKPLLVLGALLLYTTAKCFTWLGTAYVLQLSGEREKSKSTRVRLLHTLQVLLNVLQRQSVLIATDSLSQLLNGQSGQVSTSQLENLVFVFFGGFTSTAISVFIPDDVLNAEGNSVKTVLQYSIVSRFSSVQVPGMGSTLGGFIAGLLFVTLHEVSELLSYSPPSGREDRGRGTNGWGLKNKVLSELCLNFALILANVSLQQLVPSSPDGGPTLSVRRVGASLIVPFVFIIGAYIVISYISELSGVVKPFLKWRTATDVRRFISTLLPGAFASQTICLVLVTMGVSAISVDNELFDIVLISAIQTVIDGIVANILSLTPVLSCLFGTVLLIATDFLVNLGHQRK